ncbi:adenylate/guanilate cyclase [Pelomyxa schiedti]|nr:adenylate/guanilate cyclase [Pelomyxa schiedti]
MNNISYTSSLQDAFERQALATASEIQNIVSNVLYNAEALAGGVLKMFSSQSLSINSPPYMMQCFHDLLMGVNVTSSIWLGTKFGGVYGYYSYYGAEESHGKWFFDNGTQYDIAVDIQGNEISVNNAIMDNCTQWPWYTSVQQTVGYCTWVAPYLYYGNVLETLSCATFQNNSFVGVSGVDIFIQATMNLLKDFDTPGQIFLIDSDENIWGCTDETINTTMVDSTGQILPLPLSMVKEKNVKRTSNYISRVYGTWQNAASEKFAKWIDTRLFASAQSISRRGLNWIIVVVQEPSAYYVDWHFVLVSCILTAFTVLVSVTLTLHQVTLPLKRLQQAMTSIVALNFTAHLKASRVKEIHELADRFEKLSAGINAMTKYVPRSLVQKILASTDASNLTMEPGNLSIMFCDLQGFSQLSENYPKTVIADVLCKWFARFSEVIVSNKGTIDKYIGDCIMAIWGAPDPIADHPFCACSAVLGFRDAIESLNKSLPTGYPQLKYRVGLHCGEVLVGNIGYEQRMNYTVCGNSVNIAARLEQAGKRYKLSPLISGDMYKIVKKRYLCVWLDVIIVPGYNNRRIGVYHLLCEYENATPEQVHTSTQLSKICHLLQNSDFTTAHAVITESLPNNSQAVLPEYTPILALLDQYYVSKDFAGKIHNNDHT